MSDEKKQDHDLDQELFNKTRGLASIDDSPNPSPLFSWTKEDAEYTRQKLFEHPDFDNLREIAFYHADETERQRDKEQIKKIYVAIAKERVKQNQD
jgi:hypothetical protein